MLLFSLVWSLDVESKRQIGQAWPLLKAGVSPVRIWANSLLSKLPPSPSSAHPGVGPGSQPSTACGRPTKVTPVKGNSSAQ